MFNKLCRIGNDPVIRHTPGGDAVLSLSLAYSYGKKGDDGKKPTQWLDAAIWGKQSEGVAPYLKKGDQISVSIDDLHISAYQKDGVERSKLSGRIVSFDFVSGKSQGEPAEKKAEKPAAKPGSSFDNFDDDIPFN